MFWTYLRASSWTGTLKTALLEFFEPHASCRSTEVNQAEIAEPAVAFGVIRNARAEYGAGGDRPGPGKDLPGVSGELVEQVAPTPGPSSAPRFRRGLARVWVEPPAGIEPTTYSLRGRHSASHPPSSSAFTNTDTRTTLKFHHEFPGVRTTSCTTRHYASRRSDLAATGCCSQASFKERGRQQPPGQQRQGPGRRPGPWR